MAQTLQQTLEVTAPATAVYRRRWATLGVLALSLVVIGLDNTILNVALPTIQREFTASAAELQWMVDAYIVVFAGLLLLMGALGDRYGRARALQLGLVIFGVASVAAAYSTTSSQLIASRVAMGVGGALIMPATLSIIINVFPREERGRAIAVWAGLAGLGVGLGPLVGGLLLEHFWWGAVFLINVPIVLIALGLGVFLVPDSRDPSPTRLDWPGALLSIGGISTLVYALIEAPSRGWTDTVVVGAFASGAALLVAFAWRERTTDHPMLDLALFRDPHFSIAAAAIAFAFFALFGVIFILTQYLQFVRGLSALQAGMMMLPIALGLPIGASASVRLVTRFGTTRVVASALLVLSLLLGSMTLWGTGTELWIVAVTLLCVAATMANVMAPSTESVMGAVPDAKAGVGSAMNDVVRQVAGAFAIAIVGSVLATVYTNDMEAAVSGLPSQVAGIASDSIGGALAVASQVGGPAAVALKAAADSAFIAGMGTALLVAALVALTGSSVVYRLLPGRRA